MKSDKSTYATTDERTDRSEEGADQRAGRRTSSRAATLAGVTTFAGSGHADSRDDTCR